MQILQDQHGWLPIRQRRKECAQRCEGAMADLRRIGKAQPLVPVVAEIHRKQVAQQRPDLFNLIIRQEIRVSQSAKLASGSRLPTPAAHHA